MTDVNILELSYSFGSLESRAESALSKLSGLFQSDSRDAHVRSIVDLLSTQHAEGSWGSDDYPILKAVFTAQGMQTLHSLGMETREGTTQPNSAYLRAKNWLPKRACRSKLGDESVLLVRNRIHRFSGRGI
jgi:hypothetical protein